MSEQLNYKVNVDTNDAVDGLDNLNQQLDKTDKSTKNAAKNAKAASGAFSSIGSTLKTLGVVSIVSKGFSFFTEVLGKNQKVVDFVSTSVNFLTGVFSDLVAFLVGNTDKVVTFFKDVFENPKKYIDQLANAIKENLIERVNSAIKAFGFLGDIIKNVFTGNFEEAGESAKLFAKEMVDVATGVNNAFDRTTQAVGELSDAAGEYFTKKFDQAKELTNATNNAVIAEARMLNTIKQTEIAAERLRQKRDDETLAIEDRIAANNELLEVLQSGQKQELALLAIKANKIQAEIALNGSNKELQAELIALAGERADIEEKYVAFASEGLVNRNSLLKEQRDISKSLSENENKILLDTRKANAELIKDEVAKLEAKKLILAEESKLELKRLEDNIAATNVGTAARAEAEIAYSQKKNELAIQSDALDNQLILAKYNKELEQTQRLRTEQGVRYEIRKASLDAEQILIEEAFANGIIVETEYNAKLNALKLQRITYLEEEKQAKRDYYLAISGIFGQITQLFGANTAASKAAGLAEIAIQSGVGLVQGLDIAQKTAKGTGPAAAFAFPIFYATQVAAVLGAVNKARGLLSGVKGGGSVPTLTPPSNITAPITPQQQQAITTNLSQSSINAIGNSAIRAYVVETDITSNQRRIQAIKQRARFS